MIKLLYVDDEPNLLELAKCFLTKNDLFDLEVTVSPNEAIDLLSKRRYEAVISDYQMSEMNGIELLKKIRKEISKDIPFILFTGKGREEVVIEAINNGANFYLQKGGDPKSMFAELKQKIREAVEKERARNSEKILKNREIILNNKFKAFSSLVLAMVGNNKSNIKEIIRELLRLLNVDGAYIAFIEGRELKIHESIGIESEEFKSMVVPYSYGIGWDVVLSRKGKIINNYLCSDSILHNAEIDNAVKKEGIVSVMATPFSSAEGSLGSLYVFTRTKKEFSDEDLELLILFAGFIGIEVRKEKMRIEQDQLGSSLFEANKKLNLMNINARHAINNHITGINLLLDLILNATGEEKIKEYVLMIQKIIDRIKMDNKNMKIYQEIGINNPQWYSIDLEGYSTFHPSLTFIDNTKGLEIYADLFLKTVIENLIDNTLRHGGKATKVTTGYSFLPDKKIVFSYEDDGVGVKPEDKENIFDRGFGKNTGFGLFLIKEILSITGMKIKETGEFGKGVRFEILIPTESYRITK